jgi:hypothetical protein
MLQAVGAPSVTSSSGGGSATAVLEGQLNRYQLQLADWCHCVSANTPEGKAKIQDLTNKVDAVQAQLDRVRATQSRQPSPNVTNGNPDLSAGLVTSNLQEAGGGGMSVAPQPMSLSTVGPIVDLQV